MRSSLSPTTDRVSPRWRRTVLAALIGLAACSGTPTRAEPTVRTEPGVPVLVDEAPTDVGPGAADLPAVDVRAFAVYDTTAGTMLAQSAADAELPVGSLMKLLNARVAYDAGEPDREVRVPDGVAGEPGESVLGLIAGEVVRRDVLIRAMLKVSGNDAARALAIDIAGSEEAYAELMNDAARRLGLEGTSAENATGLDAAGQHSTARDLVTLALDLLDEPDFAATVADPDAVWKGRTLPNTNDLLGVYDGADGIKTGHTTDAGWCLLASATRDGRRVLVAVLGAPTEAGRDAAATALLDWAFSAG